MARPKLAAVVQLVSVRLPVELYDECCREALYRDEPLAVVLRERLSKRCTRSVSQNPSPQLNSPTI